jgi:FkbM family methyltransferase
MATRWHCVILGHWRECWQSGNLALADKAVGDGPFRVRRGHARAIIDGQMGGVREIWVRDVYLKNNYLNILPNAVVVDLGAGTGDFTNLALAHGSDVTVIAVKATPAASKRLRRSLEYNGWQDRARVFSCFIGGRTRFQEGLVSHDQLGDVRWLTEEQFLSEAGITRIDFLKCNIEGSEFELLADNSRLLAMTGQLTIEIEDWGGDRHTFISMLRRMGFQIGLIQEGPGCCVLLARREGIPA